MEIKEVFQEEVYCLAGHGMESYYRDTDYTGRWMTDDGELFIECFELEEVEYKKDLKLKGSEIYWERWWHELLRYEPLTRDFFETIKIDAIKIRARVYWVHEDKLKCYTQTINTCTGDCE